MNTKTYFRKLAFQRIVAALLLPIYAATLLPVSTLRAQVSPGGSASTQFGPPASLLAEPSATLDQSPLVSRVEKDLPQPTPPEFKVSNAPEDSEIFGLQIFEEPLVPTKETSAQENAALGQAIRTFATRTDPEDLTALENFLFAMPQGAWSMSLWTNIGLIYNQQGYVSRAQKALEQAWKQGKEEKETKAKALADRAAGELIDLYATWMDEKKLDAFNKDLDKRELVGSTRQKLVSARERRDFMTKEPDHAWRCGAYALEGFRKTKKNQTGHEKLFLDPDSGPANLQPKEGIGYTLKQLKRLAKLGKLPMRTVKRKMGTEYPVPSVLHWSKGHYAALVAKDGDRYLVKDSNFGPNRWISRKALDEETSGFALVDESAVLPAGTAEISDVDAEAVTGGCHVGTTDPDKTDKCQRASAGCSSCSVFARMASPSMYLFLVSLHLTDSAVGYSPAVGPAMEFTTNYNQREANQPQNFNYSNLGNLWTFDWLSYVTDVPGGGNVYGQTLAIYERGGGTHRFTFPSAPATPPDNVVSAPCFEDGSVLRHVSTSPIRYERTYPDGSTEIYTWGQNIGGTSRKVFLTSFSDPNGNTVKINYDANNRISSVVDALQQVTKFYYDKADDIYKITRIEDPFHRTASYEYNASGQLWRITDIIGVTSEFTYTGSFISKLKTPYGDTLFAFGEGGSLSDQTVARWLEITDPMGGKERVEYMQGDNPAIADSDPSATVPTGVGINIGNERLSPRNTFYWDKKAMIDAPGDYTKAYLYHWLHDLYDGNKITSVVESEKPPLENRIWYNYTGQTAPYYNAGTDSFMTAKAQVVGTDPATSTQLYTYTNNTIGNRTKMVDPVGRETKYNYYPNGVDLQSVQQKNGAAYETLSQYGTYNSAHLPSTITDAAGQVTSYQYNASGKPLTISRTRNGATETTTHDYYTTTSDPGYGRVKTITGPLAGATTTYTYDGVSRVKTVTDSSSYVLTYDYDTLDRITRISYPDGTYEQTLYSFFDPIWKRDRLGRWTHMVYDAMRRMTFSTDPEQRTTEYRWCTCGLLEAILDGSSNKTSFVYDIQSRLTQKIYADTTSLVSKYENTTNRLKRVTDAKNQVANYSYNKDNTLESVTYTDNSTPTGALAGVVLTSTPKVSYTYDPSYNRITTMVDGTGTTSYGYYPITTTLTLGAGRLQFEDGPMTGDNDKRVHTYDEYGRELSCAINGVADARTYDALGRVDTVTNPLGAFTYGYVGLTPRLDFVSYPNGQKTSYSYYGNTGDNRLQQIKNLPTVTATIPLSQFDYTYNAVGNITGWQQNYSGAANPVQSAFAYDRADQLSGASLTNASSGAAVKQYGYWYDKAGNRTDEQIDNTISSSGYNPLNQLTSRSGSSGKMSFEGTLNEPGTVTVGGVAATVDGNNKWKASVTVSPGANSIPIIATDVNGNTTTTTDANGNPVNKKVQVTVASGTAGQTIAYDENGNIKNDGTRSFEWDVANRLIAINYLGTNPVQRTEFIYNGISQRVRQVEKNGTTVISEKKLLWCGVDLREERSASDVVTKRYYKQGMVTGNTIPAVNNSKFFYTKDHLGSIREMTDNAAVVAARYSYDPYGRRIKENGVIDCDFGYTGHFNHNRENHPEIAGWAQSELILSYYRAYDANFARWLSRDPIGESGGINLYDYVANNSLNLNDPLGLQSEADCLTKFQKAQTKIGMKQAGAAIGGTVFGIGVVFATIAGSAINLWLGAGIATGGAALDMWGLKSVFEQTRKDGEKAQKEYDDCVKKCG